MGEDERMTITEFLQARLDEIEHSENGKRRWHEGCTPAELEGDSSKGIYRLNGELVTPEYLDTLMEPAPDQRVLRDVEAKRAIIAHNEKLHEYARANPREDAYLFAPGASDVVLKHLAYVWSDHPDYREDWRP